MKRIRKEKNIGQKNWGDKDRTKRLKNSRTIWRKNTWPVSQFKNL